MNSKLFYFKKEKLLKPWSKYLLRQVKHREKNSNQQTKIKFVALHLHLILSWKLPKI